MRYWPHARLALLLISTAWIVLHAWSASAICSNIYHGGEGKILVQFNDAPTMNISVCTGIWVAGEGSAYEMFVEGEKIWDGVFPDTYSYYREDAPKQYVVTIPSVPRSTIAELCTYYGPGPPNCTKWAYTAEAADGDDDLSVTGLDFLYLRAGLISGLLTGFDFNFWRGLFRVNPVILVDDEGRKVVRDMPE